MILYDRLIEKYKRHRLSDGTKLVVPSNYDVTHLSAYKSVGKKLFELANEDTPLLMQTESNSKAKMKGTHPSIEVHVSHHVHAHHEAAPTAKIAKEADGSDSDGSDDLEVGLKMTSTLRLGPGQLELLSLL